MLLFGRLMERNTKHHGVTYSLTLFSNEFLLEGVMQMGCFELRATLIPVVGARWFAGMIELCIWDYMK